MRFLELFRSLNYMLVISIVYFPVSFIVYYLAPEYGVYLLYFTFIPALILFIRWRETRHFIDIKLGEFIDSEYKLRFFSLRYPAFKYVDIYNAVHRYCEDYPNVKRIQTSHHEDLNTLISGNFYSEDNRKMNTSEMRSWPVDYDAEDFFPQDLILLIPAGSIPDPNVSEPIIFRVKFNLSSYEVEVEYALENYDDKSQDIQRFINDYSKEQSIYKGKTVELGLATSFKDEYGDVVNSGEMGVYFKKVNEVNKDDIVLEDHIERLLERNVFNFHKHRDDLKLAGIPGHKALLFYGPPGTGKTYTSQYIHGRLEDITTIVVVGTSLNHVKAACNLARSLQPSLMVLEDVDLVFTSREINLYSSALGDLMDELDGFQKKDDVIFILTTNAIERMEKAIKERPGRISQCVHFGMPNKELRERYLKKFVRNYRHEDLDTEELAGKIQGATQAFMKELVQRAVHISLEENEYNYKDISLANSHFDIALTEMTQYDSSSAGLIMGYQNQIL
ncbi:MAG: ATP-binding protein [Spirochaetota bacterium]|nr:ATP-binding protein [Spirochaetota bacterium]